MVKVGFICEGKTETTLLSSFNSFLQSINIESVDVIDVVGCANLKGDKIEPFISSLIAKGAETIVVLTDLDDNMCITKTKESIRVREKDIIIIAVRQIEAWFLAATKAMQTMLEQPNFSFAFPEAETTPFQTINQLLITNRKQGIGNNSAGKIKLIKRLLLNGYSIQEAAQHPNCQTAKYFINKLQEIATL
jgi:hypothetical protein